MSGNGYKSFEVHNSTVNKVGIHSTPVPVFPGVDMSGQNCNKSESDTSDATSLRAAKC